MKTPVTLIASILSASMFFFGCTRTPVKNVLEQNNIRGAVRSITETAYVPSGDTLSFEYRMTFEYDTLGNQTSGTRYDISDSVKSKAVYTYSHDFRCATGTVYGSSGEISSLYRNEYGRNGLLSTSSMCLPDGTPQIVYRYEYDDGHLSAVYGFDGQGTAISKDIYTGGTPPAGQEHYGPDGTLSVRYGFSHDSLDNDTSLSVLDGHSNDTINVISYSYQYDSRGNWTEKNSVSSGDTISVVRRAIEYYR